MSKADIVEKIAERVAAELAREMRGIVPDRVYTPDEAAELIGLRSGRRGKTIKSIPKELLPPIPILPSGRTYGYSGRDLLAYIADQRRKAIA